MVAWNNFVQKEVPKAKGEKTLICSMLVQAQHLNIDPQSQNTKIRDVQRPLWPNTIP